MLRGLFQRQKTEEPHKSHCEIEAVKMVNTAAGQGVKNAGSRLQEVVEKMIEKNEERGHV